MKARASFLAARQAICLPEAAMQHSFFQKFLMTIFLGFIAACALWVFRHILEEAFHESGSGWKEMYKRSTPARNIR